MKCDFHHSVWWWLFIILISLFWNFFNLWITNPLARQMIPYVVSPPENEKITYFEILNFHWGHNKLPKFDLKFCEHLIQFSSVQSLSRVQLFVTPRTAGLLVHHQLSEFTQTHVHWVRDAIQPSNPLPSPSPPTLNLAQHQCLSQWVISSHQVAKVLEFQLQHQSLLGHLITHIYNEMYICI